MQDRPGVGAALFLTGLAAATGMDALVKLSAGGRSLGELLLCRGFGALPFLFVFAMLRGGLPGLRPRSPAFVLARGTAIALGTGLFFWSLEGLNLATAYVVAFTAPLMLTVLAATVGSERVGWRSWLAVGAGFMGVLAAVAPGSADLAGTELPSGLAALAATFLYALGLFLVRHGGGAETPGALVLGSLLPTGALGLALVLAGGNAPTPHVAADLFRLVGVAALAGVSQIFVTLAFAVAPASKLAPCEYATLPLGAAFGYLLWGDVPSAGVAAGAVVVGGAVWLAASETDPGSSAA